MQNIVLWSVYWYLFYLATILPSVLNNLLLTSNLHATTLGGLSIFTTEALLDSHEASTIGAGWDSSTYMS